MIDYEILRLIWWLILGVLLIGFAVTDGFDLGVGAVFRFVGRNDEERRALLESIEPVWEGNQVWFILAGGAAFAAWPLLYATSFSSMYFALFLVLLALIMRPVGFAFRGKLAEPRWRTVWDWALCIAGVVPSLLFGVAFGNLFMGVPFHFDELQRPVYTGGFVNLLHPFALLSGVVSLAMLVMHGATYASLKTDDALAPRTAAVGRAAALVFVLAFIVAGLWLGMALDGQTIVSGAIADAPSNPVSKSVEIVRGAWLANFRMHPLLWLAPGCAIVGALVTRVLLGARRYGVAFVTSAFTQAGTILTGGFALFPFLMPSSSHPDHGLTVWDASSSQRTLFIMLIVVLVFLPMVLAYTAWAFRVLRGRITLEAIRQHTGFY
jgi:cytochrome bd ubiquinol oxidase subunit II